MQIRFQRAVAAPPALVFERMCDFANAPQRIPAIKRVEMLTDGPVRVGTRFRETRTMFGREATEEMTITKFEPGRSYTLGAMSCGSRFESELRVEPGPGGAVLSMSIEATPLSFFAKVMSFVMRPMMKKMAQLCAKDLDDLKSSIERELGTPA